MQLRKHWLKEISSGPISTLPFRAGSPLRRDKLTTLLSRWALQTPRKSGSMAPQARMHLSLYNFLEFLIANDLVLLRRIWHHNLYSCAFQVTDCKGSTTSTSSHWTRGINHLLKSPLYLSSFKTTLFVWEGPRTQHHSSGKLIWIGVSASFGHTAPAGAEGTLPGHWRWQVMQSCAACAGHQQKASAFQKATWFVFVSKWLVICGKFCFFSLFTLLKYVIIGEIFGRHLLFILNYVRYQLKN